MTAEGAARPRPRAFWSDARFLLGVVLIVASVAGVWLVVATARQTSPVFAAARTLVPGDTVVADDLHVVEVALGATAETYATPTTLEPGAVAVRTIEAGELVPLTAIDDAERAVTTTISLRSAGEVPSAVATGTVVEIWAAPQLERGEFDTPRILVPSATVVSVTRDDSMMGTSGTALEVVIDRAAVADALAAIAADARLSVVPTAGSAR
ncbi:SAF domain-containing protein [Microbacterium invictum]|uniref:SAF domain-containing protein n=1 Tax=Microbacterium invictum TaxID=515415 RepID=A0AA40VLT9_9MICO|nr:SAF domain-containing protein [Microbacterium invictum]MBB4139711.1 hypothetical protein [Microbacterium invictum]